MKQGGGGAINCVPDNGMPSEGVGGWCWTIDLSLEGFLLETCVPRYGTVPRNIHYYHPQ